MKKFFVDKAIQKGDRIMFRHEGAIHLGEVVQIRSRGYGVKVRAGKLWNVPPQAILRKA